MQHLKHTELTDVLFLKLQKDYSAMVMDVKCDGGDKFAEGNDKSKHAVLYTWFGSQESSDLVQQAYKARCNDLHDFFGPMMDLTWKEDQPASVFFFDKCTKALVMGQVVRRFKADNQVINVPQRYTYLLSQIDNSKPQKFRSVSDSKWEIDAEHSSTPVLHVLRLKQELSDPTSQP